MNVNIVECPNQEPSGANDEIESSTYFFYGTLMFPKVLTHILNLPMETTVCLTPAAIKGFKIMMWGPYPALVPAPSSSIVKGKTYKVCCKAHKERLAYYETHAYQPQDVTIALEDGTEVAGKAFVWAGDMKELEEGSFDESSFA